MEVKANSDRNFMQTNFYRKNLSMRRRTPKQRVKNSLEDGHLIENYHHLKKRVFKKSGGLSGFVSSYSSGIFKHLVNTGISDYLCNELRLTNNPCLHVRLTLRKHTDIPIH